MAFEWFQRLMSPFSLTFPTPTLPESHNVNNTKGKAEADRSNIRYGVELEYVLAFHELELDLTDSVGGGNDHGLEKEVPLAVRRTEAWSPAVSAPLNRTSNLIYNSWGIVPNNIRSDDEKQHHANIRPYELQPQTIVLNKLNEKVALVRNKVRHKREQTRADKVDGAYDRWIISTDRTVVGQGSKNLNKWLPRLSDKKVLNRWDSYGIEVISPVLRSNNARHTAVLEQVVNALRGKGDELYEGFITNQCALHVHVEAPDLEVVKELTAILLIYEEEISRLHPACRRPGHRAARGNLTSNRIMPFLASDFVPSEDNIARIWDERAETSRYRQRRSIQEIREEIDRLQNEQKVAEYMGFPGTHRLRVVNFRHLRGSTNPRTIEFRQARGSLDPYDVIHWVNFCLGLVHLAEYYVQSPDARIQDWADENADNNHMLDVFYLLDHMQMDKHSMRYWKRRIAKFMIGGDEDERSDVEHIPDLKKRKKSTPKDPKGKGKPPDGGGPSPPKPPSDGKDAPHSGVPKSKTPSPQKKKSNESVFPPVPPLLSPSPERSPQKQKQKSQSSPEKPELSSSQKVVMDALAQSQARHGSDKSFFEVATDEGSTIPPLSPVPKSPQYTIPTSGGNIPDTSFKSQPTSTTRPQYKPPLNFPDFMPLDFDNLGVNPEDWYRSQPKGVGSMKPGSEKYDDKMKKVWDAIDDHLKSKEMSKPEPKSGKKSESKSKSGEKLESLKDQDEGSDMDWNLTEDEDEDEDFFNGIFSGNFAGAFGSPPKKQTSSSTRNPSLLVATNYLPISQQKKQQTSSSAQDPSLQAPSSDLPSNQFDYGLQDPHEDFPPKDIPWPNLNLGSTMTSQKGTSPKFQGKIRLTGSAGKQDTGIEVKVEKKDENTERKPGFLLGSQHPGNILRPLSTTKWDDDGESDDEILSEPRFLLDDEIFGLGSMQQPGVTRFPGVKNGKRLGDEIPETDQKAQKKPKSTSPKQPIFKKSTKKIPKKSPKKSPATPISKPVGRYRIEAITELINAFTTLPSEEFEANIAALYDTDEENQNIVSQVLSQFGQQSSIASLSNRPPQVSRGNASPRQNIQVPGTNLPDTSGDAEIARRLGASSNDGEQFAREIQERYEHQRWLEMLREDWGVEHPPPTRIGLERLEEWLPEGGSGVHARLGIMNFRRHEWESIATRAGVSGRAAQCGAAAVVYGLRAQYPNEPWMQGLTPESFLADYLDTLPIPTRRADSRGLERNQWYDEDQLNNALQRLTNGELQLAVEHRGRGLEILGYVPGRAILTALGEPARYLYLRLNHYQGAGILASMHWEGIRRRPGYKEHE